MATGKRASMREGPLADLFRRTTDDNPSGETAEPPAASAPEPPAASAPEPPAPSAPEPTPTSPAGDSIRQTPASRRRAHPSLEADARSPSIDEPAREIPSPQERLRHAFPGEGPQN